jgi:molecular chaperone DnaJ
MERIKDYYKILGVSENSSQDEIKKAYRDLAKKYHPDKHKGDKKAETRFKEISEAHTVLGNPTKRKEYDRLRKNPFAGGFNPGDYQHSGGSRVNFGSRGGGFGGLDDLLSNLFNFGERRSNPFRDSPDDIFRQSRTRATQKGPNLRTYLTIDFELAARGGETFVQTLDRKKVKLKIPAGIEDGTKMKLTGLGSPSPNGGEPGDLLVEIRIAAHPKYERKGVNIYSSEKINFAQAIFGTEIEVVTINGKKVKLKVPPGTSSGKLFRLKGLGIQTAGNKGDFFVRIEIETPQNLSSSSKKDFKEWAKKNGIAV